jgi:hypothetical protein
VNGYVNGYENEAKIRVFIKIRHPSLLYGDLCEIEYRKTIKQQIITIIVNGIP